MRMKVMKSMNVMNTEIMSSKMMNSPQESSTRKKSFGFTLTEVLVAVVLTLILLGLMIRAFAISGSEIAKGRALLELAGQLRSTAELLRRDLNGVTVNMIPRNQIGGATGYFEYIEGGYSTDSTVHVFKNGNNDESMLYGDVDDILMFTCRSLDQPFRGRFAGQIIESNYAEVVWWTVFVDENANSQFDIGEDLKLYRRVMLIRPDLNPTDSTALSTDLVEFQQFNDVSVRQDATGNVFANTLSDLSNRANRFARAGTVFPYEPNYTLLQATNTYVLSNPTANGTTNLNSGEDVMLSGLAGFDVQAFDPVVEIRRSADQRVGLAPSDFGYNNPNVDAVNLQFGGYVDLGIGIGNGLFTAGPLTPTTTGTGGSWSGISSPFSNFTTGSNTYCTWTSFYESDGYNQDDDLDSNGVIDAGDQTDPAFIDEGINGFDDDRVNAIDDIAELETLPPYPYALRGIKVTIRIAEPTTQVVRQTSVIHNFVPE